MVYLQVNVLSLKSSFWKVLHHRPHFKWILWTRSWIIAGCIDWQQRLETEKYRLVQCEEKEQKGHFWESLSNCVLLRPSVTFQHPFSVTLPVKCFFPKWLSLNAFMRNMKKGWMDETKRLAYNRVIHMSFYSIW